ncbi:MAG: RDD family protein [Deinococcales bacterium]|nr:RDD family protein [Deinococcales bacterium]
MTDRDPGPPLPPVEPDPAPEPGQPTPPQPPGPTPGGAPPYPDPATPLTAEKPDVGRRVIAYVIDWAIAMVLYAVVATVAGFLGSLVGAAYMLLRDGFEFEFMNGRSLGKRLMNLTVSRDDGGKMDLATSARRNWPLAIGMLPLGFLWLLLAPVAVIIGLYEAYNVLTATDGRRWGDKMAHTRVRETQA